MEVKVRMVIERDELFKRYEGETDIQPCNVCFNTRTGEVWAEYDPEIGGAMPMKVWDGEVVRWQATPLLAEDANKMLSNLAPVFRRYLDAITSEDIEARHVSFDEVTEEVAKWDDYMPDLWEAKDWASVGYIDLADKSDEELKEIAETAEWAAEMERAVFLGDVLEALKFYRDYAKEKNNER